MKFYEVNMNYNGFDITPVGNATINIVDDLSNAAVMVTASKIGEFTINSINII